MAHPFKASSLLLRLVLCLHLCGTLSARTLSPSQPVTGNLSPFQPVTGNPDVPTIPWVPVDDETWRQGEPTFLITPEESGISATGWAAISNQSFLLHVRVTDPHHHQPHTAPGISGPGIWQGDCLQVALDGYGDGTRGMAPETRGPMDRDDIALALALTPDGPKGWIYFLHRSAGSRGPLSPEAFEVTRTGDSTTYTLRLPWSLLGITPGLSPCIGLAVQVNNNTPGIAEQTRSYFGRGADDAPRPGLHQALALGTPTTPVASAAVFNDADWNASNPARIRVALKAASPLTLSAQLGESRQSLTLPADGHVHRFDMTARASEDGQTLRILATAPDGSSVLDLSRDLIVPEAALFRLLEKIDAKLAGNLHPLFALHLQSVRSLCLTEWARLGLYLADNPQMAQRTLEHIRGIEIGLDGDSGEWEAYLDGRRALIIAYPSPHDATLQYYALNLPRDWDPEKKYPLFFELHGSGDANPISLIANRHALDPEAPQFHGYETPKTFAEIQRNGFHVHPWCRGNLGYRGIAEIDVLEAYDHAHKLLNIDENRRYLYGFSMGGGGTWSIGLRTPDRWAAIAIFAGSSHRDPPGLGIGMNATSLPVWIWCGEEDRLFPDMQRMVAELRSFGIEPVTSSTPGLGHVCIMEKQEEGLNWLQQFTRKRPDTFRFRADTDRHTGIWGIHLTRNPLLSAVPTFQATLDGNTVHIDSEGTPSLTVNPGPGGLGLKGDFQLFWNGQPVYNGPVTLLRLQDGTATPSPAPEQ